MFIEGFTQNMKLSYYEVKRCLAFRSDFSDMYVAHNKQLQGTPYQVVYENLANFEYAITSGALDDEAGPEYNSTVDKIKEMREAIDEVLKSSYTLSSKYKTVYNMMLETHQILQKI